MKPATEAEPFTEVSMPTWFRVPTRPLSRL
jgi:hypothetical protein